MKLRFFYRWNHHEPVYGRPPYLRFEARLIHAPEIVATCLEKYLLSALATDFSENRFGEIDEALDRVDRIEHGELGFFETGGQDFSHHISLSRVRFEHSVFGECPEWPIWYCTLAQYKATLQGYRHFLDMPKSIDSELVIELPDGEAEDC